jgi:hypothetical protein
MNEGKSKLFTRTSQTNNWTLTPRTPASDVKVTYNATEYSKSSSPNAIAFDLDETLGSFTDFHPLWAKLEPHMKTQSVFNELMDLYPEFLRVGIIPILRYIRSKQRSGQCLPIFIYTNNQCSDCSWIYKLIYYLECLITGVETPTERIFARPICAYKINKKRVEPLRTTHEKTYSDFVQCSMVSTASNICFIDDVSYKKMETSRVYYIQPPPYIHPLTYQEVIDRFVTSQLFSKLYPDRTPTPLLFSSDTDQPKHLLSTHQSEQRKITNKIMYYIREFFLLSTGKKGVTQKRNIPIGRFSRKKRRSNKHQV